MDIKSAEYRYEDDRKNTIEVVLKNNKRLSIMISDDNRHYKEVKEWEKVDGNTITDNPPE